MARYKTCYDFDSADEYYDYLSGKSEKEYDESGREPKDDEPEENYRETDDRNFPSNDVRWME